MFGIFKPSVKTTEASGKPGEFAYLKNNEYYFDSACQTLRFQSVIDAEVDYYQNFNSCGHRVHYKWGLKTDQLVEECRANLLKITGKSAKDYTVAFTLNTTMGLNQVLQQLPGERFEHVVTSEIEHNSVFLPTLTWARRHGKPRLVLPRVDDPDSEEYGGLKYNPEDLNQAVVVLNSTSNIDGRNLVNGAQVAKDAHARGGVLLLDACQTFAHAPELLKGIDFDAAFGSGHKMYGPSVGFVIIKKSLLMELDCFLIGGSTVQDVQLEDYQLIDNDKEIYSRIEPGLQNYAGIVGLNQALKVLMKRDAQEEHDLAAYLNSKLKELPGLHLLNPHPSPVVSLYADKINGHELGLMLSEQNIMCRTGYHCCHYYLKAKHNLPPLFRISLGLHNTREDIDCLIQKLSLVLQTLNH